MVYFPFSYINNTLVFASEKKKTLEFGSYTGLILLCLYSDIYPSLERICLEGNRAQSKFAVSAIAALVGTSEQFVFSELCKV